MSHRWGTDEHRLKHGIASFGYWWHASRPWFSYSQTRIGKTPIPFTQSDQFFIGVIGVIGVSVPRRWLKLFLRPAISTPLADNFDETTWPKINPDR
jgi:hypothetical protein